MNTPDVEWRRAAAYAMCRDQDDRLLLTRFSSPGHPDHGGWTLPGGALEWGESPAEAAVREVEEETGLRVELGSILGVFSRWYSAQESVRGEPGHVIGVLYEATSWARELRTAWEPGTTDGAEWFSRDEIRRDLPHVELVAFALDLL